jgi:hypothetical protein
LFRGWMSGGLSGLGCILSGGIAIDPHDRRSRVGWECRYQVGRGKSRQRCRPEGCFTFDGF